MATINSDQKHFWFEPQFVLADFGVDQGWTNQTLLQRHLGDVNGDGVIDIVGIGYAGLLFSSGFSAPKLIDQAYFPNGNFITALADASGDGRADLLDFSKPGFYQNYAVTFPNEIFGGRQFFSNEFGRDQGWLTQEETPRLMADVNGDGRADIIGFGYAGTIVSLSYPYNRFVPTANDYAKPILGIADFGINQGWDSNNLYYRTAADVNGDGWDDIIGFGDGGVSVSLFKGNGTFADMIFALEDFGRDQGWSSQDEFPRLLGDVNGDGRADIVGIGIAGVYVAYGQSDGTFAMPKLDYNQNFTAAHGWTSNNVTPRMLADVDGNGLLDLVGFGYAGIYVLTNFDGFPPG